MLQHPAFWGILAASVPIFWLLPQRLRYGFLAGGSGAFLMFLAPWSVLALLGWVLVFHRLSAFVRTSQSRRRQVTIGLTLGVAGFLAYYKFMPSIVAAVVGESGAARIIIPLGISYYTFKLIHYIVETARGSLPEYTFPQFLCYMLLFPTFTAGPIQRFDHFLNNLEPAWSSRLFVEGATRIVYGLVKKLVLAAPLVAIVSEGPIRLGTILQPEVGSLEAWGLLGVMYLYIYLDFSAYTDIAIGCSRLFGIHIMENFNFPIIASNIRDYWRRWHMTLSGWCQSYVYMPVLGLYRKPLVSLYLTFLVMGLWHAGTTTRVAWGCYHATGVAIFTFWNRFRRRRGWKLFDHPVARPVAIAVTQLFVSGSMAFLIFDPRGELTDSLRVLGKLMFLPV